MFVCINIVFKNMDKIFRKKVHDICILDILEYAVPVWSSHTNDIDLLDIVQLRIIDTESKI